VKRNNENMRRRVIILFASGEGCYCGRAPVAATCEWPTRLQRRFGGREKSAATSKSI